MDPEHCTLDACPIQNAYIHYQPTIAGNSVYLALFGIFLFTQLIQSIFFRMWGFAGAMAAGLVLEKLDLSQPWTGFLLCCPLPAPRLDHHHLPRRRDLAVEAQKLCHLLRFMRCHCAHPAERRWSSYLCGRRCRWSTNGIERHDCRSSLPGCCTDSFYCPSFGVCNLSTTDLANNEIAFMILEGAMVSITCLCLTIMHPGIYLGSRNKRKGVLSEDVAMLSMR
ncbi:RTA1 domain protein, putative [Aspergillus fumigatus A1163]|uniref:RTA1 domain protein, putative n=1 Tax=Aspergillus fumigatus (strain CBS 144.89 / FGSC A1163 / CEA10) TaxID=451804 RepID=B0YEV9_ASPFC|nr:RTA1 domain protein, putative [Aspergillus fumigatus A1163]